MYYRISCLAWQCGVCRSTSTRMLAWEYKCRRVLLQSEMGAGSVADMEPTPGKQVMQSVSHKKRKPPYFCHRHCMVLPHLPWAEMRGPPQLAPSLHISTWSQRQETCKRTSHNRFGNSFKVSAKATNPSRHVAVTKGVVGLYRSGLVRSPPVPQYGESFPHSFLDDLENPLHQL
jgi:hypothetical protein